MAVIHGGHPGVSWTTEIEGYILNSVFPSSSFISINNNLLNNRSDISPDVYIGAIYI